MTARSGCVIAYEGGPAPRRPRRLCRGTARPRQAANRKRVLCARRGPGGRRAGDQASPRSASQQLPLQRQAAKDSSVPILSFCCSHNVQKPRTPSFETGKGKTPTDPEKTMTKTFSLVRALVIRTNVLFNEHDREKLLVSTTVNFFPMCLFVINPHFKTRLCPESIPNCDN